VRAVIGALLLCASTIVVALAVGDIRGAGRDGALARTKGTVESVTSQRRPLLVRSNSPNAPTHETVIHVAFSYSVDGVSHRGTRYSLGEEHETIADDAKAQARVAALRTGSTVDVYYDPRDASQAVLARRTTDGPIAGAVVGGLGGLIGLGLLASWWARRRRYRSLRALEDGVSTE
jgi:hypothetical protein